MNYADIKYVDVANGPGIRVSLFVSGCTHHCKGCFNREAWDFNYGNLYTEETQNSILAYLKPDHIQGLSLLGGEPLEEVNMKVLTQLLREVKKTYPQKDIWCYTGYTFDKDVLGRMMNEIPECKEFISYIDILVDGKFEEDKKNVNLHFRGSSNQRIIDVKKSMEQNKIVPWVDKPYNS